MRKWGPLLAVCLGSFMLLVDVTIVIVALPDMGADLGSSYTDLQWVLDAYSLALAALMLGAGSLADRIGRRRVFVSGTVVFTAASLLCAMAPDTGTLIAARALQGVGGAAMFATTIALLGHAYQGRDRGVAFGVWGSISGAAAAVGPIMGGLLTQHLGWEAIFLVNVPIGVLTVAMCLSLLTESHGNRAARPDPAGMVTFTLGAALLTYGFVRAGAEGWTDGPTLGVFAAAGVAFGLFVVVEARVAEPMIDLALFRRASFSGIMLSGLLVQFSAFAAFPALSVWLQSVLGYGPVRAGLALLPLAAVSFVASAVASRLPHGTGPRWPLGIGALCIGLGAFALTLVNADSDWTALLPGLLVAGIGVGLAMPQMAGAALTAVPPSRAGMAGGALNTFRQLGFALGIAVVGVVFRDGAEHALRGGGTTLAADPHATAEALGGGRAQQLVATAPAGGRDAVVDTIREAFASGLDRAFLLCGALGLAAGVLALLTVPKAAHAPAAGGAGAPTPERDSTSR
ncbi:MFS transporter [Embleya scabrispora]|uniref:MFS transporter n=1 Tax=Embleya scabrispora TaxID=159449 RepID=A0A1T3NR28_9ACTN|nr:MFS transporter [Embleya scabrispora]OPC79248.1 MFS transporter [Embleya scabrispora]